MSGHAESAPTHCANCGSALGHDAAAPRFCPNCGQETRLHSPTFWEFVHEFVGHCVALEGALWKTLALLIFRPGRLTLEYLGGRRRRYVLPLRVYLSAGFVFFVAVKLLGGGPDLEVVSASVETVDAKTRQELAACAQTGTACNALERRIASWVLRIEDGGARGQDANQRVNSGLLSLSPYAMFAMQPVFAALVMAVYRRRQQTYDAHFVFSLHLHAFWSSPCCWPLADAHNRP